MDCCSTGEILCQRIRPEDALHWMRPMWIGSAIFSRFVLSISNLFSLSGCDLMRHWGGQEYTSSLSREFTSFRGREFIKK